jgi:regulator of protease activity HflC (stomatin/prohibitin superfamily)
MLQLALVIVFLILAIICPKFLPKQGGYDDTKESTPIWVRAIQGACVVVAAIILVSTSVYWVGQNQVAMFERVYWGEQLPSDRIIAMPWQKGPQARIAGPGFHFELGIKISHDITTSDIIEVPEGNYGFVTTKDGMPFNEGQYMAKAWPDDKTDQMMNALYFMGITEDRDDYKGPRGQMGPQLTVLRPGKYRINKYLYEVKLGQATDIPVGFVGVIKSNVGKVYEGKPILPYGVDATDLSVPIVPKGYRGVWSETLKPGRYYLNQVAYVVTPIDTRVQTWKYLGGYTRRWVDLEIGDDGKIKQTPREEKFNVPEDAADSAIVLRVEGWDVFQDSRVQVQVSPENAPFVVASVGGIQEIEDKIITPNYRSIIRNVVAKRVEEEVVGADGEKTIVMRPRKVLDLLYMREMLETEVFKNLQPQGRKTGLTVQWVRFGDPAVPPELLVPGKREQLADQLERTYAQEKEAQIARVQTEKERARADQQPELMKSEIGIKVAENNANARRKEGDGEKYYLTSVAKGQEAQANVLGKDKAAEIAIMKMMLDTAAQNPDIIQNPRILVQGQSGGFEGAAAILGESTLTRGINTITSDKGGALNLKK